MLDQQITNEIKGEPAELFQMGCHHFAFWVDDIDEMMAAGARGGHHGGDGRRRRPGRRHRRCTASPPGGRVRSVFLQDPEGNYVQLDQRA